MRSTTRIAITVVAAASMAASVAGTAQARRYPMSAQPGKRQPLVAKIDRASDLRYAARRMRQTGI